MLKAIAAAKKKNDKVEARMIAERAGPFFWVVSQYIARNQSVSGLRVSWNIVPAAPRFGGAFAAFQQH